MSALRLYEIADQYQHLINNLCDDETGEVSETSLAKLDEIKDTMENKAINLVRVWKQMEAYQTAIEKERKAMEARESHLKKQVSKLKEYLMTNMQKCDITKIECPQFKISLQKNPPAVKINDPELIPEEYKKIEVKNDVSMIKDALKMGIEVPGATLEQGVSVRIR